MKPEQTSIGDVGMRHYSLLTGKPPPRNDNAATANRGEVGKQKNTGKTDSSRKRLPAYARPLAEMRKKGTAPASRNILIRLDRWLPEDHPDVVAWPQCVIPPRADPALFDFGFCRGLDAAICWWRSKSDGTRVRALAKAILAADPTRLIVLDIEHGLAWFIKSVERGVEVEL